MHTTGISLTFNIGLVMRKHFLVVCKYEQAGQYLCLLLSGRYTVKLVLSGHYKRRPKIVFQDSLMQVKSIVECSKGSILQYFRPSLSYHLSLRSLFFLFLSGRISHIPPFVNHIFNVFIDIYEYVNLITCICNMGIIGLCLSFNFGIKFSSLG